MREFGIILAIIALAASTAAAEHEPSRALSPGGASYQSYCSGCHGQDARGTAAAPGIDLTRLASKYGQPLAGPRMLDHIGGRRPLRADWMRGTQVCGQGFLANLPPGLAAQLVRRGTAMEILRYLDGIQVVDATKTSG